MCLICTQRLFFFFLFFLFFFFLSSMLEPRPARSSQYDNYIVYKYVRNITIDLATNDWHRSSRVTAIFVRMTLLQCVLLCVCACMRASCVVRVKENWRCLYIRYLKSMNILNILLPSKPTRQNFRRAIILYWAVATVGINGNELDKI